MKQLCPAQSCPTPSLSTGQRLGRGLEAKLKGGTESVSSRETGPAHQGQSHGAARTRYAAQSRPQRYTAAAHSARAWSGHSRSPHR